MTLSHSVLKSIGFFSVDLRTSRAFAGEFGVDLRTPRASAVISLWA